MIQNVVNYQKLGCNFRHDLLSNVGLTFSSFLAKELNDRGMVYPVCADCDGIDSLFNM